jgi:hypothetical protein
MDFQNWQEWAWTLLCLGTGIVLGTVWTREPLKSQVKVLQSLLAQERVKNLELAQELKWSKAKVMAQESDLDRLNSKWLWKE